MCMLVLPRSFFCRQVFCVAPELLGKYLVRKMQNGEVLKSKIVEVEAYDGEHDLACHASRGKTERTTVMYETGGVWYVYLVYGMYHMLNIVTGERGYPAAVLIRAVEDISGPGRLTKHFAIDRELNGMPSNRTSGLWIEDIGTAVLKRDILRTPRIGVDYAGAWAKKPYRFVLR